MTGNAESHPVDVVHLEHLGHSLHIAVAGSARIRAKRLDVTLMREMCVPRQVMHPHPLDWLFLGPGLPQLLDLRLMGAIPAPNH
jgi:hypothetical protein